MKKVILIGFAACYKTSVGSLLASRLGCAFVDTDKEIERLCNKSVQQIFETNGEEYFRERESQLLRMLNSENTVVACGGGSVLSPDFDTFSKDSIVICLTASAQTVYSRLGGVCRPLFDGLTVEQLHNYMQKRAPLYNKYAQSIFSTDNKTPEQVTEQILDCMFS